MLFRGPRRSLNRPYVAFVGGNETYGRFIPDPYPDLVEEHLGYGAVNLGHPNAGVDFYLNEMGLAEILAGAEAVVVQVLGAGNLSNRYYQVHPRRNDRFIAPTPLLRTLYREVDFTEFSFTRHLLFTLRHLSPERFELLAEELRSTWVGRMKELFSRLPARSLLLWLSDQAPPARGPRADLDHDPLLVDAPMVAALRPLARTYVEAVIRPEMRGEGIGGMAFSAAEAQAAAQMPGPAVHRDLARLLVQALDQALR